MVAWDGIEVKGEGLTEQETHELGKLLRMFAREFTQMRIVVESSKGSRSKATAVRFDEDGKTVTIIPALEGFTAEAGANIDLGELAHYLGRRDFEQERACAIDGSMKAAECKAEVLAWMDISIEGLQDCAYLADMLRVLRDLYASAKGHVVNTPARPIPKGEGRPPFYMMINGLAQGEVMALMANYNALAAMSPSERENIFIHEAVHVTPRGRMLSVEIKRTRWRLILAPGDKEHIKRFLALAVQAELEPELTRQWYLLNIVLKMPGDRINTYLKSIPPPKRARLLKGLLNMSGMSEQEVAETVYHELVKDDPKVLADLEGPDLDRLEREEGLQWLTDKKYRFGSGGNAMPAGL